MATSTVAPPVVELGRWAGWSPLPLSVRDARRAGRRLRISLDSTSPTETEPPAERHDATAITSRSVADRSPVVDARGLVVRYGRLTAVAGVDLVLRRGEVTALMGRNGCGKSSLLWALQGSGRRTGGAVTVDDGQQGCDPRTLSPQHARALVGLVPQEPGDLLYLDTVAGECRQADTESERPAGTCAALLERIAPGIDPGTHPGDLSEGQRLSLVLAVQLTADPLVLLLDEPTRGLDYAAKRALRDVVRELTDAGRSVLLSTHDVEFAAEAADRVVVMAEGEVVADGPARDIVLSSPAFAPQIAKVLSPAAVLTVDDVREALPLGAPA
jgi:energy-coupling factor transport system ATP-binding protein